MVKMLEGEIKKNLFQVVKIVNVANLVQLLMSVIKKPDSAAVNLV